MNQSKPSGQESVDPSGESEGNAISIHQTQEGIEQNIRLLTPIQEEIVRGKYFLKS
jgi:hypothetical protein